MLVCSSSLNPREVLYVWHFLFMFFPPQITSCRINISLLPIWKNLKNSFQYRLNYILIFFFGKGSQHWLNKEIWKIQRILYILYIPPELHPWREAVDTEFRLEHLSMTQIKAALLGQVELLLCYCFCPTWWKQPEYINSCAYDLACAVDALCSLVQSPARTRTHSR